MDRPSLFFFLLHLSPSLPRLSVKGGNEYHPGYISNISIDACRKLLFPLMKKSLSCSRSPWAAHDPVSTEKSTHVERKSLSYARVQSARRFSDTRSCRTSRRGERHPRENATFRYHPELLSKTAPALAPFFSVPLPFLRLLAPPLSLSLSLSLSSGSRRNRRISPRSQMIFGNFEKWPSSPSRFASPPCIVAVAGRCRCSAVDIVSAMHIPFGRYVLPINMHSRAIRDGHFSGRRWHRARERTLSFYLSNLFIRPWSILTRLCSTRARARAPFNVALPGFYLRAN